MRRAILIYGGLMTSRTSSAELLAGRSRKTARFSSLLMKAAALSTEFPLTRLSCQLPQNGLEIFLPRLSILRPSSAINFLPIFGMRVAELARQQAIPMKLYFREA